MRHLASLLCLLTLGAGCAGNDQFWAAASMQPQPQMDYATRMTRMRTALHTSGAEGARGAIVAEIAWAEGRQAHPVHQQELPLLHRELGVVEMRLGRFAEATAHFDEAWKRGEERLIAAEDRRGRPVYLPWQFWGPATLPFYAPTHEAQLLPTYATLAWLERGHPQEALVEVRRIELAQRATRGEPGAEDTAAVSSEIAAFALYHGGATGRAGTHSSYYAPDGVDTLFVVHAGAGPSKEIATLDTRLQMGLLAQFPLDGGSPALRAPRPTEQLGMMQKYGSAELLPDTLPSFPGPVLRTAPPCRPQITLDGAALSPLAQLDVHDVAGKAWARTRAFDVTMSMSMALSSTTFDEKVKGATEACSRHPTTCGADTRHWSSLPAAVLIGRASLPVGDHTIAVRGCHARVEQTFEAQGPYRVVQIWVE
jgi:hypothetical protein